MWKLSPSRCSAGSNWQPGSVNHFNADFFASAARASGATAKYNALRMEKMTG